MTEFEFVDELPPRASTGHSGGGNGRRGDPLVTEFVAALKARPGVWAKWPKPGSRTTLQAYAGQIRRGELRSFRGDGFGFDFDGAVRGGVLYVRYIGPKESDGRA